MPVSQDASAPKSTAHDISKTNLAAYRARTVITDYKNSTHLQPAENTIFTLLQSEFQGKTLLDIGVGSGRTTPHMLRISDQYLGIDYSPEMIEACRERFPSVRFEVRDARRMSDIEDKSFDLILFSFNGIDYVNHSDRIQIINDVARLLSKNGVFIFSTHNRNTKVRKPWDLHHLQSGSDRNPIGVVKSTLRYGVGIVRHLMRAGYEVHTDEFAILNDPGNGHRLLTYYIGIAQQLTQLKNAGFHDVKVFDRHGLLLGEGDYKSCTDGWIYYLCRAK